MEMMLSSGILEIIKIIDQLFIFTEKEITNLDQFVKNKKMLLENMPVL